MSAESQREEAILSSGGSETGWAASSLPKPERWLFLTSPLPQGKSHVSLNLLTRGGTTVVSAWVWGEKAVPNRTNPFPMLFPT